MVCLLCMNGIHLIFLGILQVVDRIHCLLLVIDIHKLYNDYTGYVHIRYEVHIMHSLTIFSLHSWVRPFRLVLHFCSRLLERVVDVYYVLILAYSFFLGKNWQHKRLCYPQRLGQIFATLLAIGSTQWRRHPWGQCWIWATSFWAGGHFAICRNAIKINLNTNYMHTGTTMTTV